MSTQTEITTKQLNILLDLIDKSNPWVDTVGPRHNPTTRTSAHAKPHGSLFLYLKGNGWLKQGEVLVCHSVQCSDEFRIVERFGKWTISHIPVG